MIKKIAMLMAVCLFSIAGISGTYTEVSAEENREVVDSSYLRSDNALIGYDDAESRGVYLASGYSVIQDAGNGKIAAGGGTDATTPCKVSINVIVERLSGGSWVRVTSWTSTLEKDLMVVSSKVLSVAGGYYYRVRCVHRAAGDSSSSMTSSLWM